MQTTNFVLNPFLNLHRGSDPAQSQQPRDIQLNSTPVASVIDPSAPKPPERKQAIVKPVLTHVIGGFHIQEGLVPFPVSCARKSSCISHLYHIRSCLQVQRTNTLESILPAKSQIMETDPHHQRPLFPPTPSK